jgi:hypothetical protein
MDDRNVLDFLEVPGETSWRLWRYDRKNTSDLLPGPPVAHGTWTSIQIGHVLLAMKDGNVLDWVPGDGTWRLWNYDPGSTHDILPGKPVAIGQWHTIVSSHKLAVMKDGRVLDSHSTGPTTQWRLWDYVP